jgi:AraC-like DNA-binding protein
MPGQLGARVLEARACSKDWHIHHESFGFCVVHGIDQANGGGRVTYRQFSAYDTEPGQVQLFQPGESHKVQVRKGGSGDFSVVFLPEPMMHRASSELLVKGGPVHFSRPNNRESFSTFKRLCALLTSHSTDSFAIEQALLDAIDQVIDVDNPVVRERPNIRAVARALEYFEDLLHTPDACREHPRLDAIAKLCGASGKSALCHDFKAYVGRSPYDYFKARRLNIAQAQLEAGKPIRNVAWSVGYDPAAFSRQFRGHFGVSPRAYQAAFR